MRQTFITTLILFCVASIQVYSQTGWKTFHHKNGFDIQLPSTFSMGLLIAGGTLQWFDNSLDKKIEVTGGIWQRYNW